MNRLTLARAGSEKVADTVGRSRRRRARLQAASAGASFAIRLRGRRGPVAIVTMRGSSSLIAMFGKWSTMCSSLR